MKVNLDASIFGFSSLSALLGGSYFLELTKDIINIGVAVSSILSTIITISLLVIKVIRAIKSKNIDTVIESMEDVKDTLTKGDEDDTRD
ncbi:MAG: hypothetical protein EOM67_15765 [Spirochaetia bacterium]|nr:hypothetical protein [Spirochaetia bacterium]